jgi:hypothetical protein
MKTKVKLVFGIMMMLCIAISNSASAQTDSTATTPPDKNNIPPEPPNKARSSSTKFLLAGKATTSWTNTITQMPGSPDSKMHTFFPDGLMLMPLVKLNNRLFLDAQVELTANGAGGGATMNLNELIVYYRVAPALSIFAGNFSPKYGLFIGTLDDFTNRFTTDPIGMARGPQTQTGVGIQGGFQAGYSKFNYQFYLSNGPQYIMDSTGATHGMLDYGNYTDNNRNKAIGGSIGFLPLPNSSLQIDVSGQYTAKTGADGTPYENISSTSWAVDVNYFKVFNPIMIRVLAEYNTTTTDDYNLYTNSADTATLFPKFKNQHSGWYAGATIRASGAKSQFLSGLELGFRVGGYNPPKYDVAQYTPATPTVGPLMISPWGENPEMQTTLCLTYWFTYKTPLSFAYDVLKQTDGPNITTYSARFIYFF